MRSRPSKRGDNLNHSPQASSYGEIWTSGQHESVQQSSKELVDGKTRRGRKSSLPFWILSVQIWLNKHTLQLFLFLFLAILLTTVLMMLNLPANESSHQKWSHRKFRPETIRKHEPLKTRGLEVSPLAGKFDIILPNKDVAHQSNFGVLQEFGRHRRKSSKTRTFGGLNIQFLEDEKRRIQRREIYHDFEFDRGFDDLLPLDDDYHDYYYAFDDDKKRNPLNAWNDDKIQDEKMCRRTKWHRDLLINCNTIHEFDVERRFAEGGTKFLG